MRTFFRLCFILPFSFLISCQAHSEKKEEIYRSYHEIEAGKKEWNQLFSLTERHYFFYIYSLTCAHCNDIKNSMIDYGLSHPEEFYFCQFTSEIPIGVDTEETIGKTSLEEIFILGTPALLEINDHVLTRNLAGGEAILSYLDLSG